MPGRYVPIVAMAALGVVFCQETASPDLRIRVSVNLVQIDVTVTDAKGAHIPGLNKNDFELFLDGQLQPITNFGYVALPPAARSVQTPPVERPVRSSKQSTVPPAPEVRLPPEQVRRAVALFVDDVSMSAESVPFVRNGLHKAIESEVGPDDLAAVIRASAGMGALQDFTTDKQRLLAAADQVHWSTRGRGELAAYRRIKGPVEESAMASLDSSPHGDREDVSEANLRTRFFLQRTIDSLERVIDGMAGLPGRKAVVVLSDDLTLAFRDQGSPDAQPGMHVFDSDPATLYHLRRCVDAALRSGVVIYAVDTRGLNSLRALASDNLDHPERFLLPGGVTGDTRPVPNAVVPAPATRPGDFVVTATQERREVHQNGQEGGFYLASATGGLSVPETNDIGATLRKIYSDLSGYYVLAFHPPDDSFERYADGQLKFDRILVRVRKPGLHVRTRAGFLGESSAASAQPKRARLRLSDSLASPFGASEISTEMHATFLRAKRSEPFIHVSLFVDPKHLSLAGPEINRSAIIHLLLRTFDVHGAELDGGIDRLLRVSLNQEGYARAMKYGLVYSTTIQAPKPGPYEVRAAVLDEASGAMGSANELVTIPKASSKGLELSGILFEGWLGKEDDITPAQGSSTFHHGQTAPFVVEALGPADAAHLKMEATLFRDGVALSEPVDCPIDRVEKAKGGGRMLRGSLTIPSTAESGDYAVQVAVTEQGEERAVQWANFRVE